MKLHVPAFPNGGDIPAQFTCDAADLSPAISWDEVPNAAAGLALIVDDPDAPSGLFTHWTIYDLPAEKRELQEDFPRNGEVPGGGAQGRNDFGRVGYNGPCPPPGKPHRYYFRLYALRVKLDLKAGASRADLDRAMKGKVLAGAEHMGRYTRAKR